MTTYLYFVLISIKTSPEKFNICFRGYSSPGQLGVHWTMFNIELWLGYGRGLHIYILFWFWLKHLWKNSTFAFTAILHLDIWVFIEQCSTLSYGLGKDEEMRRATRHAMIGMIKYRLLKVAVVLGQSKHIKATKSRQQYQGNNIKTTISRQQYQGNNIKATISEGQFPSYFLSVFAAGNWGPGVQ